MDAQIVALVLAGGAALGLVVWVLAKLGKALRQVVTRWRTSLTVLAVMAWWQWWGGASHSPDHAYEHCGGTERSKRQTG